MQLVQQVLNVMRENLEENISIKNPHSSKNHPVVNKNIYNSILIIIFGIDRFQNCQPS